MKGRGFNSHSVQIFLAIFSVFQILFALLMRRERFGGGGFFVGLFVKGLWFRDLAENL